MMNQLKKTGLTIIMIGILINIVIGIFPSIMVFALEEEESEEMMKTLEIEIDKSYTLMPLDEGQEVPEGFVETMVNIDGKDLPAWRFESEENRFYLLYAYNEEGEEGFYQYDASQETLQRYQDHALVIEERYYEAEKVEKPENITTVLLGDFSAMVTVGILSFVIVILIILLITMVIKRKAIRNRS